MEKHASTFFDLTNLFPGFVAIAGLTGRPYSEDASAFDGAGRTFSGRVVGSTVGLDEGTFVGCSKGFRVNDFDGAELGFSVGIEEVGATVG